MELIQLHRASQLVSRAILTTGLLEAVNRYRRLLAANDSEASAAQAQLVEASTRYVEQASAFNGHQQAVADKLNLTPLGTLTYWSALTSSSATSVQRQAKLTSIARRLMVVSGPLTSVFGLVDDTDSRPAIDPHSTVSLYLYDDRLSAADPDRVSRTVDGLDMIYEGCALLADVPTNGLQLLSIDGEPHRRLVFTGHIEAATATRRIVRSLNERYTQDDLLAGKPVDAICESLPFLQSINDLYRADALSGEFAGKVHHATLAGAIMLAEAGAQLAADENISAEAEVEASPAIDNTLARQSGIASTSSTAAVAQYSDQDSAIEQFIEQLNKPER